MTTETNSLTKTAAVPHNRDVSRVWIELRHPLTRRIIGKYCAATRELEVVDRKQRSVIELPSS